MQQSEREISYINASTNLRQLNYKMQKKLSNLCRLILSDRNTRNLFFFLLLNLFFAFVELTYGLWTNSLGLISDSFHMFFDCSALLLGLAASLVTKWKANDKFTYGFGRAEILAGLANGLFLLFIALFIMKEAIERTFEPPEVHHERLFVISVLGFIVNLVGIFVFQHGGQGHHHGHSGCSHSHSHSHSKSHRHDDHHHDHQNHHHHHNHNQSHDSHGYNHYASPTVIHAANSKQQAAAVALDMNGYDNNNHVINNNHHDYNYNGDIDHLIVEPVKKSGRGQIMESVFLHIVADTLGSIGVMVSAVLMNQFGWMVADPLCSLFIAILISISVYPLLRDSFYVLMQRIPVELEDKLPNCLDKIRSLNGVLSVHDTHFWALNSDTYVGCLKLEVTQAANLKFVSQSTKSILNQMGVEKSNIQIDQV